MDSLLVSSLAAGAIGAAGGLFLPRCGQILAEYKWKKKGRELVPDGRFSGIWAMILCAIANGLGWGLCWFTGSDTMVPGILAGLIWSLGIILILVDLRLRIIPNEALLGMLILGVTMEVWLRGFGSLIPCVISSLTVFSVCATLGNFMGLYKIGAGDVKLAMVMTMSLGFPTVLTALFGFAGSMLVFCLIGLLLRKITLKSYLPLGPFLVPGFWVGLVVLLNTTGL